MPGWAGELCGRLEIGLVKSPEREALPEFPPGGHGVCEENDSCSAVEALYTQPTYPNQWLPVARGGCYVKNGWRLVGEPRGLAIGRRALFVQP